MAENGEIFQNLSSSMDLHHKKASISINNSSSNGMTGETSFMAVLQQAGMGGRAAKKASATNASQLDDIISNFVSHHVKKFCHQLVRGEERPATDGDMLPTSSLSSSKREIVELTPSVTDSFAAVIMVDVSGYSKLTAALAERGPIGAELLSKTMKGYLDQIIEVILSYGGDIVKFAGDAVVVYWSSSNAVNMSNSKEDIERGELVYKAAHCCLTLLTKLGSYDINIPDCNTKTLAIHLGIGAGLITDVVVGGAPGRWEHFIAGDAVNQLSQVLDLAKAGELALSHQALKWLVWVVDIRTLSLGEYDKRCIILQGLAKAERRVPAPEEAVEQLTLSTKKQKEDCNALHRQFMDKTALFKLQADINQSNLFRLDPSIKELLQLSELRQITTIFIKIDSLKDVQREEILEHCQQAISVVQAALAKCDGSLRQFQVDDKGAAILCFFGLPPLAHENDARLGVLAGIEIRDRFLDMFDDFSMGITTGVVSFGGVGAVGRAEYAVMGDSINMAARLMCHNDASRGILVDQKTFNLCQGEFEFESLGDTKVKGKSDPISIFRPVFAIPEADKKTQNEATISSAAVIGRESEKKAITDVFKQLQSSPQVDILLFSADGGLGLSTLVNYAKTEAINQGCNICVGKAGQMEQHNFTLWRTIVLDLVQLLISGSRNKQGHFLIPDNAGTIGLQEDQVILPTSLLPIKPGTKPKRKETLQGGGEGGPHSTPNKHANVTKSNVRRTSSPDDIVAEKFIRRYSADNQAIGEGDELSGVDDVILIKFKKALEKVDLGENEAALLHLVTKSHEEEADDIEQAHLRLHAKDLCNILIKIINVVTIHNKVIIQITEAHWVDSLSWELLLEICNTCPRMSIMIFSRPEAMFDSKENRRVYKLIEQSKRSKGHILSGLNAKECDMLILSIWNSTNVKSVDPIICESIFKRTAGNPFFISSLVAALRDSGQWRVNASGVLTTPGATFDFDKLVLGYDNQSMVLAQFDKLDRNFQLFLKVASVLGQKFALDDVLYFLTGIQNASNQIDKKNYEEIILGIQNTDKYGFLSKDNVPGDGAYFQFKSTVIRKCIYNMMVVNQRQQIHYLVASFLESKTNEQNRHRFIVQILEHYMGTSEKFEQKRIYYTSLAANYYFEKESVSESIKYFKQLLELYKFDSASKLLSQNDVANCNRELGYMLVLKDELDEAELYLKTALQMLNYPFPQDGYKLKWALNAEIAKRKKLDKTFFQDRPVPKEEDFTQSYVARKDASGYSLTNLASGPSGGASKSEVSGILPKIANLSPAQQLIRDTRSSVLRSTQHALVTLAEVYLKKGNFQYFHFLVLVGLNMSTDNSAETHLTRLFSLGALSIRHTSPKDVTLAAQYMEAAVSYDLRIDINTSLHQVRCSAQLLFLGGQFEASSNKLEVVSYLSTMANDLPSRLAGLNMKSTIQTHSSTRDNALNNARLLYELSSQREHWLGKIWGCFHIIHNLLGDQNAEAEIASKAKEMNDLWEELEDKDGLAYLPVRIAFVCINILIPFYKKGKEPQFKESIVDLHNLITRIQFHQWQCFIGLLPLGLALVAGIDLGLTKDAETQKIIDNLCDVTNKCLKAMIGMVSASNLRRIFKGIKLYVKGKNAAAAKAWKKGISEDAEDLYTQAFLHSAIAKVTDSEEASDKAEDIIRDLKSVAKFNVIFK